MKRCSWLLLLLLPTSGCVETTPSDDDGEISSAASALLSCAPAPSLPLAGATTTTPFPSVEWTAGTCQGRALAWYTVQVAPDSSFANVVAGGTSYIGRWVPDLGVAPGSYVWRARARDTAGAWSMWSAPRQLRIAAPPSVIAVPAGASRQAIQDALDRARDAAGGARVTFAAGATYRLTCPAGVDACLDLDRARDVQIEGRGARFEVLSPVHGFLSLKDTRSVVVRDLSVDYATLPYAEARVTAIDPGRTFVDAELLAGMPDMLAPHMVEPVDDPGFPKWAVLLDPARPGAMSPRSGSVMTGIEVTRLAPGRFRLRSGSLARAARLGDIVHKQARINGRPLFTAARSEGLALTGLTIYASPAGVVNAPAGSGLVYVQNRMVVAPGRFASTNADAIHAPGMTLGPWIEESVFWGGLDDYTNLRPPSHDIVGRSTRSVTLRASATLPVGSVVTIYDRVTGATTSRRIAAVRGATLDLDGAPGAGTFLYAESEAAPATVIRRNTYRGGLRYGLLLRTPRSVVDGNVFERTDGAAIALENHPWRSDEGVAATDLLVINNLVDQAGGDQGSIFGAVTRCESLSSCSRTTSTVSRALAGVRFVGNEVDRWTGRAIALSNGDGVEIRCSTIGSGSAAADGATAIDVDHSRSVVIADNRVAASAGVTPVSTTDVSGLTTQNNGALATPACALASTRRGALAAGTWP